MLQHSVTFCQRHCAKFCIPKLPQSAILGKTQTGVFLISGFLVNLENIKLGPVTKLKEKQNNVKKI